MLTQLQTEVLHNIRAALQSLLPPPTAAAAAAGRRCAAERRSAAAWCVREEACAALLSLLLSACARPPVRAALCARPWLELLLSLLRQGSHRHAVAVLRLLRRTLPLLPPDAPQLEQAVRRSLGEVALLRGLAKGAAAARVKHASHKVPGWGQG